MREDLGVPPSITGCGLKAASKKKKKPKPIKQKRSLDLQGPIKWVLIDFIENHAPVLFP